MWRWTSCTRCGALGRWGGALAAALAAGHIQRLPVAASVPCASVLCGLARCALPAFQWVCNGCVVVSPCVCLARGQARLAQLKRDEETLREDEERLVRERNKQVHAHQAHAHQAHAPYHTPTQAAPCRPAAPCHAAVHLCGGRCCGVH